MERPAKRRAKNGEARAFIEHVIENTSISCVFWPFGTNGKGYPVFGTKGTPAQLVHRYICREVHGNPPTEKHEAAHSCGNGHLGCVNPRHLSWKTSAENMEDIVRHGRSSHHKLTRAMVSSIFTRAHGGESPAKLAREFGLNVHTVKHIKSGKRWGHVTNQLRLREAA
jgi:hypothetical protein